jgi:toxin ParE1/3/4
LKLVWTASAFADRLAIYDYIEAENPRAAVALDERFAQAADRLREHPEMGRPGRIPGTRELVVHRRYLVVSELAGDTVYILAVVHTARQWPPVT